MKENTEIDNAQIYSIIPQLVISPEGVFKYIIIKCYANKIPKGVFIRGDKKWEYHAENFDAFAKQLKKCGF